MLICLHIELLNLIPTSHTERGYPLGAQEAHGSQTDTQARECFQCTTGMSWNRYEIALLFIIGLESLAAAVTGASNEPIALVISTLRQEIDLEQLRIRQDWTSTGHLPVCP